MFLSIYLVCASLNNTAEDKNLSICASTLLIVDKNINRSHAPTPFSKLLLPTASTCNPMSLAEPSRQWVVKSEMKTTCSLKTKLSYKTKMEKKIVEFEPM